MERPTEETILWIVVLDPKGYPTGCTGPTGLSRLMGRFVEVWASYGLGHSTGISHGIS